MTTFTEAPVSFNVKAIAPNGYDVMLTLRGDDSGDLMGRALKALDWLSTQGFSPTGRINGKAPNGNTHQAPNGNTNQANTNTAPVCPTHGKEMKPSKFGGWYCPAMVAEDDGTGNAVYCKQKVKE